MVLPIRSLPWMLYREEDWTWICKENTRHQTVFRRADVHLQKCTSPNCSCYFLESVIDRTEKHFGYYCFFFVLYRFLGVKYRVFLVSYQFSVRISVYWNQRSPKNNNQNIDIWFMKQQQEEVNKKPKKKNQSRAKNFQHLQQNRVFQTSLVDVSNKPVLAQKNTKVPILFSLGFSVLFKSWFLILNKGQTIAEK